MKNELTPEQIAEIITADKKAREAEYLRIMNEAATRLNVKVQTVIVSHGSTAVANLSIEAQ